MTDPFATLQPLGQPFACWSHTYFWSFICSALCPKKLYSCRFFWQLTELGLANESTDRILGRRRETKVHTSPFLLCQRCHEVSGPPQWLQLLPDNFSHYVHGTHLTVSTMVLDPIEWAWIPHSSYVISTCFSSQKEWCLVLAISLSCFTGSSILSSYIESIHHIELLMFKTMRNFFLVWIFQYNNWGLFVTQVTMKAATLIAFFKCLPGLVYLVNFFRNHILKCAYNCWRSFAK